jgi:hypothetical protein
MANRTYIFAIDKVPKSFNDRPVVITGLSEWAYALPLSYMLLLSDEPRLCSSLCFSDNAGKPVSALCGKWGGGASRLLRLLDLLAGTEAGSKHADFLRNRDETRSFLEKNRQDFVLLETAELDVMDDVDLAVALSKHLESIRAFARLVNGLDDVTIHHELQVGGRLEGILAELGKFEERHLPSLGINSWSSILYFAPQNAADFKPPPKSNPQAEIASARPPVPGSKSEPGGVWSSLRRLFGGN